MTRLQGKRAVHVTLTDEVLAMVDAMARADADAEPGVEPDRSAFIRKLIREEKARREQKRNACKECNGLGHADDEEEGYCSVCEQSITVTCPRCKGSKREPVTADLSSNGRPAKARKR